MTEDRRTAGQPPLADLLARYMSGQSAAHATGLAAVPPGDVEPHEAVPVQAVDPRQAWGEAATALTAAGAKAVEVGKAFGDWPPVVAAQPSVTALPLAAGNYPQLVRDLAPLFRTDRLADLLTPPGPAPDFPRLAQWAAAERTADVPQRLLVAGVLRLAGLFDAAAKVLRELTASAPAEWRDAAANEEAALLWQRGEHTAAADRWGRLPESVPVLFNRGMAALFLGRPADARAALRKAVERLPESSGWHHLGRLYLALAGG
jgi:tetratricopeptide (TPR) repeat protein